MRIGAHVSAAGGISKAITRAQDIGAETLQIFASSPRSWGFKHISEEQVTSYRKQSVTSDIYPTFLHGIYLVNVGGSHDLLNKSVESLSQHMDTAAQIGAEGVIFHSGSHKGVGFEHILDQSAKAFSDVLTNSPGDTSLIIENCAGMGHQIGSSFYEIGQLINAVGSTRIKVCLDTQHCFAAGYNLSDKNALDSAMEEFDKQIGLHRLIAIHANDSKVPFNSGIDRHENIGAGHMGTAAFKIMMEHTAFQDIPFILEVPGEEGTGPDKVNIDRLKSIRDTNA